MNNNDEIRNNPTDDDGNPEAHVANDILETARLANEEYVRANKKVDTTYRREVGKFIAWVMQQPELQTTQPPFITRQNVDHYFERVVTKRTAQPRTVRRVVSALQNHADNYEHTREKFVIEDATVIKALEAQKIYYMTRVGTPGKDPHYGVKDRIPYEGKNSICRFEFFEFYMCRFEFYMCLAKFFLCPFKSTML